MILEGAKIKILRIFLENWFKELSIKELVKKSGLGRTWIYKNLNEFIKCGLVKKKNKLYSLDKNNLLVLNLKQTFDLEKLYTINNEILKEILSVFDYFKLQMGKSLLSFLIVGSTARLKRMPKSDVDFLIISTKKEFDIEPKIETNVILLQPNEFEKKYIDCDDFVLTSLAYGLILYDNNFIVNFLKKPLPFPTTEQIEIKKELIRKNTERIYKLIEINDLKNANNELKNFVTQSARIKIIENGEIPLSRSELAGQLKNNYIKKIITAIIKGYEFKKDEILEICEKIEDFI